MPKFLNVAPILYESTTITAEQVEYSDGLFETLFKTHRHCHLIKRSGNSIRLIPISKTSKPYGGEQITIDLKTDLSMVSSLAREAIYRQLLQRNLYISKLKPLTYLVSKNNILDDCIPDEIKVVKGLGLFAKWEIDFRVIDPTGNGPFVSVNINVSTTPRISISCSSLISAGIPVIGYYVGVSNVGKNPDLKPHFLVIGKVISILENGMLQLDDVRDEAATIVNPIDVFLEPREDILEHCIHHFYQDQAPQVLSNMQQKVTAFHLGDKKWEKLNSGLKQLQQFQLQLTDDVPFKIGNFLSDSPRTSNSFKIMTGEKPLFVYSYGGSQNSIYNDPGIQKYGPYSKESFSPAKPRVCVICQEKKKGQVELVLNKFLNGIAPVEYGKAGKTFEFTGLKTKFYIQDIVLEFFVTSNDSVSEYNNAITAAMRAGGNSRIWDIALVQIDHNFKDRAADDNPYLVAKARFVSQGIPVQEFTLEALGQNDQRIVWSLNNMALATYAKLGGIPWLIAADKPISHELVFGIGSSTVQSSRLGQKERMIGITTVFTGDGNYFINNISAAVSADQYFDTLLSNLRSTMEKVQKGYNWQPKDSVRLIFHAFKTFKDVEANVVKQVIEELGDYNVEFSFIHIAESHPNLLFDTDQGGVGFYKKGIYAPERGKYLQLSEHTSLVCLTGAQELKQAGDGLPTPVQLILHRNSTFKDLTYLSKQVLKFGAHSWRSFMPAPMPVSVFYSQLMAQMLGQLNRVSHWNSDALYNKIGATRWFL